MTDYIACGQVEPGADRRDRQAASPRPARRRAARCSAGRPRSIPDCSEPREYDLAGAATGVVERDQILGADRVEPGDVVLALESAGLHSNGYSLVRHVFFDRGGWTLDRHVPELGRTLGEELLTPTRIYAADCLALIDAGRGARHEPHHRRRAGQQPGPGDPRVGCEVRIDRTTWQPAADLRAGAAARRACRRPTSRPPSTWASAWSPCCRRTRWMRRSGCSPGAGLRAWVCGSVAPAGSGTREPVSLFGLTHSRPRAERHCRVVDAATWESCLAAVGDRTGSLCRHDINHI